MMVYPLRANMVADFPALDSEMPIVEITPEQLSTIERIARRLLKGIDLHNRWIETSADDHHLTPGEAAHALRHLIGELTKIGLYDGKQGYFCPKSHAQQFRLLLSTAKKIESEMVVPNADGGRAISCDRMNFAEPLRLILSSWPESNQRPERELDKARRRLVTLLEISRLIYKTPKTIQNKFSCAVAVPPPSAA